MSPKETGLRTFCGQIQKRTTHQIDKIWFWNILLMENVKNGTQKWRFLFIFSNGSLTPLR